METIAELLSETYAKIGNPMVLFDTSYNLLAFTENPVTDDPIWNELLALKAFSIETVDFFNRANFVCAVASDKTVALLKTDELKYDRAASKVFDDDGIQVGCITVVACLKPFEPTDLAEVAALSERVGKYSQYFDSKRKTELSNAEVWFGSLLSGSADNSEQLLLSGKLTANNYVAVVDISRYEPTLSHLTYFRDTFAKLQSEYTYYIYMTNIVILMNCGVESLVVANELKTLNEFFVKYDIYAGLSASFCETADLRKHYRQAIEALNFGLGCQIGQQIFRYESLSLDGFLRAAGKYLPLQEFRNPIVKQIIEYDRANGSDFYRVLSVYIKSGTRLWNTCNALHMEPERLKAILRQMTDVFDVNWNDCDMLAALLITMKISELAD